SHSVWIYTRDPASGKWSRSTLDDGGMAAAGCTAADFNGDGRIDIACIGTATANLKWYENLGRRTSGAVQRATTRRITRPRSRLMVALRTGKVLAALGRTRVGPATSSSPSLAGDWDVYVALVSTERSGFGGWRRMGFAPFTEGDGGLWGSVRRRTGEP